METAEQNVKQVMEENEILKQFMGLLGQQNMSGQSQDFMEIFQYMAGMQLQLTAMVDECSETTFLRNTDKIIENFDKLIPPKIVAHKLLSLGAKSNLNIIQIIPQ